MALVLLTFSALCLNPISTRAQKILQTYDKPLPKIDPVPQADFDAATTLHEDVPYKDDTLAYAVRLPKDWTMEDGGNSTAMFGLSNKVLTELVRYNSPPRAEAERSFFRLQALALDYQTTAIQWFLPWAQERGLTLEGFHTYEDGRVEAVYVALEGDTTYIVRMTAQVNGKKLIVAEHYSPSEVWQQEKPMQAAVINSFKLKNVQGGPIEDMKTYSFLDLAAFSYPASWELQAQPIRSADHMGARLVSHTVSTVRDNTGKVLDALNGQIDINLVSGNVVQSLPDEIEKFKKDLEVTGLKLGDKIEKRSGYKLDDNIKFALVESYKANDDARKLVGYELWLAVMSSGDYYYFVTLLTPARDDDYTIWAKNSEIFKLVLQSIKPHAAMATP